MRSPAGDRVPVHGVRRRLAAAHAQDLLQGQAEVRAAAGLAVARVVRREHEAGGVGGHDMVMEALRGYVQLASGLTEVTRERARSAARALVAQAGHLGDSADARTQVRALAEDLAAGRLPFRRGAAMVKELFPDGPERPAGWAVMVKIRRRSGTGGRGWLFYETARPPLFGRGLPVCTGCHGAGVDFLLSAFRP